MIMYVSIYSMGNSMTSPPTSAPLVGGSMQRSGHLSYLHSFPSSPDTTSGAHAQRDGYTSQHLLTDPLPPPLLKNQTSHTTNYPLTQHTLIMLPQMSLVINYLQGS